MNEDNQLKQSQVFDTWEKLEKLIKTKESFIALLIVFISFAYIPLKILSLGWYPSDDALRHVAFSTIDAKWSDIVVIEEKYGLDKNKGWHQILKFLYKYCNLEKEHLLFFSVCSLFLLFNLCGIICSPSPVCWCAALLLLLNIEGNYIAQRIILGKPFIFSCAVTLILLRLWCVNATESNKNIILKNNWARYLISVFLLSLSVWIHGNWYLFMLIPLSILISGKAKKAFELTFCLFISVLIGALLSGDFYNFLYYHFFVTFNIFNEHTHNWLLGLEFASGLQEFYWIIFVCIIIIFCIYKNQEKLDDLTNDPIFIMVLLCWMGSILVFRFWLDCGLITLLLWLSYKFNEIIKSSDFLKIPRVRYCLFLFIIVCLVLGFISDTNGRYTKIMMIQPIDFHNETTQKELKGWEPEDGGIIYTTSMRCFYLHFYQYPTSKWKYILGFDPAIMKLEDKQVLRNTVYSGFEEDYAPWINKMTEKDRFILDKCLKSFPQLEWTRGNRTWWIGRLKKKF